MTEFFGKKGLDFFLGQAKVHRFGDELVDGWADLPAARLDPERGSLMADIRAQPAPGLDETFALEYLVDLGDRERIDPELRGKIAHGGELCAVPELPRENALLELLLQLHVERNAAGGVEKIHGVIRQ